MFFLIDDLNFFHVFLAIKNAAVFLQKKCLFVDPKMQFKLQSRLRGAMGWKGVVTNHITLRRPALTAATKSGLAYSKPDVYPRWTAAA